MYLFQNRFSMFDNIVISSSATLILQGRWLIALIIFVMGAIFCILMQSHLLLKAKNKEWQELVVSEESAGSNVPAIKKHRELFGTGLKEAVDAVRAYRDSMK